MASNATSNVTSLALFMRQRSALVNYASSIITGYLYRIVRNLALDSKRQIARESSLTGASDYDVAVQTRASDSPDPETVAVYKDEYAILMQALSELPERTRIACEMHRVGGAKLREIADYLDISVPLAHKLVSEGIDHCRERLGGWP